MALLRISIGFIFLLLLSISAPAQDKAVDTAFDGASINLLPNLLSVDTDKPTVTIRTADDANGLVMELPAKLAGRVHGWVVVSLANSGMQPSDVVVATPRQGFAGSGIIWPTPLGSRIQSVVAAGQAAIAPLRAVNSDAFVLRIEPKG